MKVELDLYSPAELDAFAAFCTAVATHSRERMKSDADVKGSYLGGLDADFVGSTAAHVTHKSTLNPIKVPDEPITQAEAEQIVQDAKKRERGKPSPGRARRTKEEIAEDDAADAADAAVKQAGEEHGGIVADKNLDAERGAISETPEDRVDPNNPDDVAADSAEDAAQDATDEAAETAANSNGKLTLDDVRAALGKYVTKFGMAAAQEDGPKVLGMVCGEGVAKISAIPEDKIGAVIAGIEEMTAKNPFKRQAA